MITFDFEGQTLTGSNHHQIIPVLDKAGKLHLAKWGEMYKPQFTKGLYHDFVRVRQRQGVVLVPCPIAEYVGSGVSTESYTKRYYEPACGLLERVDGLGTRVYLVVYKEPGTGLIVPVTYRLATDS